MNEHLGSSAENEGGSIVPRDGAGKPGDWRFQVAPNQKTSMNRITSMLVLGAGLSMVLLGCSKNQQARNVAELEKAFSTKTPAPDAGDKAAANAKAPGQGDQIQQSIGQAVAALKTNGYVDAFVTLRAVQSAPNLTLDQYTAVVNARLALEKDLAAKAVAGDPVALRAVEAIQGASRR